MSRASTYTDAQFYAARLNPFAGQDPMIEVAPPVKPKTASTQIAAADITEDDVPDLTDTAKALCWDQLESVTTDPALQALMQHIEATVQGVTTPADPATAAASYAASFSANNKSRRSDLARYFGVNPAS